MKIDAHIIAWNEKDLITLTVKYYKSFCRNVFVYDNHSTDNTRELAEEAGAHVQLFGIPGVLDDKEYLKIKNHCWKGSDADYIIACDTDEILWHPNGILNELLIYKGRRLLQPTLFPTQGFDIWDNGLPKESYLELTKGLVSNSYSKKLIFSPSLAEIGYIYGCHEATPKGVQIFGGSLFAVLHYHNIGGVERVIARHAEYEARRSENNRRWGMGRQYAETPEFKRKEWKEYYAKRVELLQAGIW